MCVCVYSLPVMGLGSDCALTVLLRYAVYELSVLSVQVSSQANHEP